MQKKYIKKFEFINILVFPISLTKHGVIEYKNLNI